MSSCTSCGHQLGVGRFCTNCGAPVDSSARPTAPRSALRPDDDWRDRHRGAAAGRRGRRPAHAAGGGRAAAAAALPALRRRGGQLHGVRPAGHDRHRAPPERAPGARRHSWSSRARRTPHEPAAYDYGYDRGAPQPGALDPGGRARAGPGRRPAGGSWSATTARAPRAATPPATRRPPRAASPPLRRAPTSPAAPPPRRRRPRRPTRTSTATRCPTTPATCSTACRTPRGGHPATRAAW